jgi:hypothetical protein
MADPAIYFIVYLIVNSNYLKNLTSLGQCLIVGKLKGSSRPSGFASEQLSGVADPDD